MSYLHCCAAAGVVVTAYEDHPLGTMRETSDGGGRFERVVLRPIVTVGAGSEPTIAMELHELVHARCFIANPGGSVSASGIGRVDGEEHASGDGREPGHDGDPTEPWPPSRGRSDGGEADPRCRDTVWRRSFEAVQGPGSERGT